MTLSTLLQNTIPPPQRQTSEGDIYQAHNLVFNQPQDQERVNRIMENVRNKPGEANFSFTNSGWSATVTLYNPAPQNLINEIRNDPCLDQLKPTISTQPNANYIPNQLPRLSAETLQNLANENDERDRVEEQQDDTPNTGQEQNDTNVIDAEVHRENNSEEIEILDEEQVTLEEDQNPNTPEEEENNRDQGPETPEDILNSPTRDKQLEEDTGEKAQ